MANILLVEDDERQIKWARDCCSNYNLMVFTTTAEFYDSEIYDGLEHKSKAMGDTLLLTDLRLPYKAEETPCPKEGLYLFTNALKWLAREQLKGVALLSNFEHHVYEEEQLEELVRGQLSGVVLAVYYLGKHISSEWEIGFRWLGLKIGSFSSNPLNMLAMYDSLNIEGYRHFMSPEGIVLSREMVEEQFDDKRPARSAMKAGCLNLKPFDFVIENLFV